MSCGPIQDAAKNLAAEIAEAVEAVRKNNPMAGSITNTVTIDFVANAQLAVGGSAAMVYLPDEGEFLVRAGGATYVNMGTMFPVYEQTLPAVGRISAELKKPWVLDPVGIGIGSLRTKLLQELRQYKPAIVRGNSSEIIALAGLWDVLDRVDKTSRPRGVDSTDEVEAAREAALAIARFTGGAVAVSGKEDLVTDGHFVAYSKGGSELMNKGTGFGCSLGGVCAVYATQTTPFVAALAAVAHYNAAGTCARVRAQAPASFKVAFIDELYRLTAEEISQNPLRVEEA